MGTKKKKTAAPKKSAPKVGDVDKTFRNGGQVGLVELVKDRDAMSARRDAKKAANSDGANRRQEKAMRGNEDDLLPDNTPVWLKWPPGAPKRALLTNYTLDGNPVCRVGAVDPKGAYTGRLGSSRTFAPDDIIGPIWLITPREVVEGEILDTLKEATAKHPGLNKVIDDAASSIRAAAPTDAQLLQQMASTPMEAPRIVAPATPKKTRRKGGPLPTEEGVCPKHNVSLHDNGMGTRSCLMTKCQYLEQLVDGGWIPATLSSAYEGRCPAHPMLATLPNKAGTHRHCAQSGCYYTERLVDGVWSPVEAEDKLTSKRESLLAGASRPIVEPDPKCPIHDLFLIQTRSGKQKLCPKDGCDHYLSKMDDGTWRVMHEPTVTGEVVGPPIEDDFLPPFDDATEMAPPWES